MQTLDSIQRTLTLRKAELFERFRIKNLAIFGSYARNEQRSDSDIDILVEFDAPVGIEFIELADQLESILKLRVDLVSRSGIKPKYYRAISNDLKYVGTICTYC
ncbi:MAG: nucleotidyltransferase family protein [Chloracidobacterium sp.]|nr:nucleotidyltransferase family protein [Chloracidobacterium sp.]